MDKMTEALNSIAEALRDLGNGTGDKRIGSIEFHAEKVKEAGAAIAEQIEFFIEQVVSPNGNLNLGVVIGFDADTDRTIRYLAGAIESAGCSIASAIEAAAEKKEAR